MKSSDIPTRFLKTWGVDAGGAYIRPIPVDSQIGIQNGAASLTDGFPPLCFTPPSAGGSAPFGEDFNGIIAQITAWSQWQNAGATVPFNTAFSTAISGYPAGTILASASTVGLFFLSTADDNTTDPEGGSPANWRGFTVPPRVTSFNLGSPPSSPISMNIGDRVIAAFSAVSSVPMHVTTTQGIYRVSLVFTADNTTGEAAVWKPNDSLFTNSFSAWSTQAVDKNLNALGNATTLPTFIGNTVSPYVGSVPIVNVSSGNRDAFYLDIFNGPTNPPDTINGIGVNMLEILFSTYTLAKLAKFTGGITGGAVVGFSKWNDTSTAWTSLGTYADANASSLSGTAVITREA